MYKVFNNDFLIVLNSEYIELNSIKTRLKVENKNELNKCLDDYFREKYTFDILIYGYNIEKLFSDFTSYFKYIHAAGGIVKNYDANILLIKRLGIWDIPKGKIEKNETPEIAALREVNEETGVSQLKIIGELNPSYHIYFHKDKLYLKKTYWFAMSTNYRNELIPQTEEDIEIAQWFNTYTAQKMLNESYRSLKENFTDFFQG